MKLQRLAVALSLVLLCTTNVYAADSSAAEKPVKVGVLTDMSTVYRDSTGMGDVLAARMAIEDFGEDLLGHPVELVYADHQGKTDVASSTARKWFDLEGVDMITGLSNSSVGLAIQELGRNKEKIIVFTDTATTELTESQCMKYGIHYGYDTHALSVGIANAIVKDGGDSWFFITADYAFGHSLQENAARIVDELGGEVLGNIKVPLGNSDFSSYLLQAQSSGAKVVALANGGNDFLNAVKAAVEFNITEHQQLASPMVFITDIKALGLETAQGLRYATPFYTDRTEETRAWSQRFFEKHDALPTYLQAATYSGTLTYLKAVKEAGSADADAVREALGSMEINDMYVTDGRIMANGKLWNDIYLMEVKTPEESEGPWDLVKYVATVSPDDAYIPLSESTCPLLDKAEN